MTSCCGSSVRGWPRPCATATCWSGSAATSSPWSSASAGSTCPRPSAERLLERLVEPFHLDGVTLRISASIGLALAPEQAADTNGLLQRADVAMYAAKAAGGGVRRYDPARDQHSRERLRTIEELRDALDADELVLHFQPQCDVDGGGVVGLEALVRWQHPRRGLLQPDQFLPLVEQTGLMGGADLDRARPRRRPVRRLARRRTRRRASP